MSRILPRIAMQLLAASILGLVAAAPASAEDAALSVVTIKGSGAPTGAPQIDAALKDLPGIAQLCIRFAKCELESKSTKKVAWGSTSKIGGKSAGVEVTVEEPALVDGKSLFKLAVVALKHGEACSRGKSPASERPLAMVSCADKGSDVEYLHHVSAKAL